MAQIKDEMVKFILELFEEKKTRKKIEEKQNTRYATDKCNKYLSLPLKMKKKSLYK